MARLAGLFIIDAYVAVVYGRRMAGYFMDLDIRKVK